MQDPQTSVSPEVTEEYHRILRRTTAKTVLCGSLAFLVLSAVVMSSIAWVYKQRRRQVVHGFAERESHRLRHLERTTQENLAHFLAAVDSLCVNPYVHGLLRSDQPQSRLMVWRSIGMVKSIHPNFGCIGVYDAGGGRLMEISPDVTTSQSDAANYLSEYLPPTALSRRYTIGAVPAESPEGEQPGLRVVCPVEQQGKRIGYILADYSFPHLLENLLDIEHQSGADTYVLNTSGQFVYHEQSGTPWKLSSKGFAETHPDAWEHMQGRNSGQIVGSDGLIVFSRFDRAASEESAHPGSAEVDRTPQLPWLFVSYIPESAVQERLASSRQLSWLAGTVAVGLLGLTVVVSGRYWIRRKRNMLMIQKQYDFLGELIEAIPSIVFHKDIKGVYRGCNRAFCEMVGKPREEIIGHTVFEVFGDTDLSRTYYRQDKALMEQGGTQIYESQVRNVDGSSRDVIFNKATYTDSIGNTAGLVGVASDITERKKTELLLREAVRAGNVGLWDWDLRTNEVYYSPEWKRQIGYEDDEIEGSFEEWQSRVHPEDLQTTMDQIHAAISEKSQGYFVEFRFRHRDGSYRWILAQSSVYCNAQNEPIRVLGSHIDITDRKKVEHALQNALRKRKDLERILNRSDVVAFTWRAEDGWPVEYVSRNIKQFGYSAQDFFDRTVWFEQFIHPEDRSRVIDEVDRYASDPERVEFSQEYRILTADGQMRWVEGRTWIRRGKDGRISHFEGILVDITSRREREQEVQRTRALWEHTFNNVPDNLMIIDRSFRILQANDLANASVEDGETVVGRKCYEVLHGRSTPIPSCPLMKVISEESTQEFEMHDDATGRDLWYTLSPYYSPEGHIIGVIHSVRDITSQKQAEHELQRTVEVLERFNRMAVGREMRMVELKREVNDIATSNGQDQPYDLSFMEQTSQPMHVVGHGQEHGETPDPKVE